ncbi:MAG: hypothetical protein IJO54_02185 [Oscillospiraceae bacterium]|nr:hypothetical protein [Oscillospiraceae bacterium]
MEIGTPFIIDNPHIEFENHCPTAERAENAAEKDLNKGVADIIKDTTSDSPLPFEFSRTRMWNENFYSPEIGNGHSIAALHSELNEIKELIGEIKDILKEIFEL